MRSARIRLYRRALAEWGKEAQIAMLHEEIGELLAALGKLRRGRVTHEALVDEIADVRIMLEQVEEIFELPSGLVEKVVDRKIRRLRGRLPAFKSSRDWTPRVALDFDGVVHSFVSGWKGSLEVADPPVPGAFDFIRDCMNDGVEVMIHSARFAWDESEHFHEDTDVRDRVEAVLLWFVEHGLELEFADRLKFHTGPGKPHAELYVDDRAFEFRGAFPDLSMLDEFRPWNKVDR